MSKEYTQALDDLYGLVVFQKSLTKEQYARVQKYNDTIEQALQRLEQIDNANSSEAMENMYNDMKEKYTTMLLLDEIGHNDYDESIKDITNDYNTIKQALAKAQENEKVLRILKKKCIYNDNLVYVAVCINYDMYKEKMNKKHDTKVVKTNWDDKVLLDCLKLLTQEEFDLLKRWLG